MAMASHFTPVGLTRARYDEILRQLEAAGLGHPVGRECHVCFSAEDALQVLDVWTSRADFEKFGQSLMPIARGVGTDPGQPNIRPLHNVIQPTGVATR
jgi:hypothetical protein